MDRSQSVTPERIMNLANAFYGSCVLFAASDAGVFGHLAGGGDGTTEGVASACGLHAHACRLLLDACVAVGLLEKSEGRYRNADDVQAFLVPGKPGNLSGAIRYNRDVYAAWGKLGQFLRSGVPVEEPREHLGRDEARTRAFVLAMHGRALGIGTAVMRHIDLSGAKRLLDLGGGPGTYAVLAAQRNPELRCTVIELPAVAAIAEELIAKAGVGDRVEMLPGSYHDTPYPGEQDIVHIFGVLHQESPEAIRAVLRKAWDALSPGGRIHIMDMMTDGTRTSPPFSALFAVNMALTTHHGWVFSDGDLRGWLGEAGFTDIEIGPLPPPMPHWIAVARKR